MLTGHDLIKQRDKAARRLLTAAHSKPVRTSGVLRTMRHSRVYHAQLKQRNGDGIALPIKECPSLLSLTL